MNLTLHNVIQTDSRGEKFMKIPEIYIRGIHIKYLRILMILWICKRTKYDKYGK